MQKAIIKDLIPAIVQDFNTGQVLMLAYVNQESYDFMIEKGETCFWSRSRKELWHKGATSGNYQKIKSMAFDCDNDTLLIQVEQTGEGACHLGTHSCFGDETADYAILKNVYNEIEDRAVNPKEKSYTNYLLDSGIDKICKKFGEETLEAVLAVKNNDKEETISEISDMLYHLLVLIFKQGITLEDINAKLAERSNVKGNLKTKNQRGDI